MNIALIMLLVALPFGIIVCLIKRRNRFEPVDIHNIEPNFDRL